MGVDKEMRAVVFSCEYATCAVPEAYREWFQGAEEVVSSGEGWDSGALNLAQAFAMRFRTPLIHGLHTRSLMDLDRDGDARWSRYCVRMPEAARQKFADREEVGYRGLLRQRVVEELKRNEGVVHVMVRTVEGPEGRVMLESFGGGSLGEEVAGAWRDRLLRAGMDVTHAREVVGSALAAELMGNFPRERYGLLRLVVSQSFFLEGRPMKWDALKKVLFETFDAALGRPVAG